MSSGYKLPLFVSSAHYGLEDLRAELAAFLESLGVACFVSSERAFPDYPDLAAYVSCLKVIERCMIVVGVIDRRYGDKFDDWGPYSEYKGLSPTHAELRHAIKLGKRLVIYVRDDVASYYDIYRANPDSFASLQLPPNLKVEALELYKELKLTKPTPWIEVFHDVRDIKRSLQQRLLNDLYEAMLQREATTTATVEALTEAFLKSDASLREAVMEAADPQIKEQLKSFDEQLAQLDEKRRGLAALQGQTEVERQKVQQHRAALEAEKARLAQSLRLSVANALAAALSSGVTASALQRVAGPEQLPLITDQELARGGIHFSGFSQGVPVIERVTFARLPKRTKENVWRGYEACLQVFGRGFAPGCKIEVRWKGTEHTLGSWTPNVYSGHYLELSTADSDESPIGDLANEYRVANPLRASEWVPFSYEHDFKAELRKAERMLAEGEAAMAEKRFSDATEPLRSAHVRLHGLVGQQDERWKRAHHLWEESLYEQGVWKRAPA